MTFSVKYDEHTNNKYQQGVDWDWQVKGEWARSYKEGTSQKWVVEKGLDIASYEALITHFGLEDLKDQLPLDELITKSWQELGQIRRDLEKDKGYDILDINSESLGSSEYVSAVKVKVRLSPEDLRNFYRYMPDKFPRK